MVWADRDPVEQAEIGYCAPKGIPLSVFRGRTVYPGEPQWLSEDQAAVLDWLVNEASRCPDCGRPISECTAKENSFAYRAEAVRCHASYAVAVEAARLAKSKPAPTAGHRYRVTRKEPD